MSNSKLNIDAGIDLYFYGKFFRLTASRMRCMSIRTLEPHTQESRWRIGWKSYRVTIKGEDLINHFKGNSNENY